MLRDQLNVLFEFEAQQKDLNNFIINAAFILLYKDLIRLFASYNEGMMNLVGKYTNLPPGGAPISNSINSISPLQKSISL